MSGNAATPFKLSHSKLINFMNIFHEKGEKGYTMNESGICVGIASMAAQAILTGTIEDFRNRLLVIKDFINSEEMKTLEQNGGYEPGYLRDQKHVDLKAFFDGVALYFQPSEYHQLGFSEFAKQMKTTKSVYNIVKPISLENYALDGIYSCSGSYTKDDLIEYLNSLNNAINATKNETSTENDGSLACLLYSNDHAIMLGYNATTKSWSVVDANQLSKSMFNFAANNKEDMNKLATIIINAFTSNTDQPTITFETDIYSKHQTKNSNTHFAKENPLSQFLDKDPVWQKIHNIVLKKTKPWAQWTQLGLDLVRYGSSFIPKYFYSKNPTTNKKPEFIDLYTAVINNNLSEVKKILTMNVVDINSMYNNTTVLYAAIYSGKEEIVKELLDHGADINIKCNNITALELASSLQHEKIINMLESAKTKFKH